MDEMVDVLNEDTTILYPILKSEAHRKGLLHGCVVAIIVDSSQHWTLVKQSSDRQDAGQYVCPVGGHISSGEEVESALKREAFEECALTNFSFTEIGHAVFNREVIGRKENHLFYFFEIHTDAPITINDEAVEFRRFSQDEIKDLLVREPGLFGNAFHYVLNTFYPNLV